MQEIICVLDRSGSMQSVRDDAVGGFNKFLEEQKKVGEANLTVAWFDDGYKIGHEGKLADMEPLKEWPNGGMTALRDAVGKTFNHVKDRFSREKPEKVIMAILTDGYENASQEFTQQAVADLIKEHQDKYGWDVIFLAADQDAWATAQSYNIKQDKTFSYDSADTMRGFATYNASVTKSRKA